MSFALKEHNGKVTNLWFADDIDVFAVDEQVLEALVEILDKTCTGINGGKC